MPWARRGRTPWGRWGCSGAYKALCRHCTCGRRRHSPIVQLCVRQRRAGGRSWGVRAGAGSPQTHLAAFSVPTTSSPARVPGPDPEVRCCPSPHPRRERDVCGRLPLSPSSCPPKSAQITALGSKEPDSRGRRVPSLLSGRPHREREGSLALTNRSRASSLLPNNLVRGAVALGHDVPVISVRPPPRSRRCRPPPSSVLLQGPQEAQREVSLLVTRAARTRMDGPFPLMLLPRPVCLFHEPPVTPNLPSPGVWAWQLLVVVSQAQGAPRELPPSARAPT